MPNSANKRLSRKRAEPAVRPPKPVNSGATEGVEERVDEVAFVAPPTRVRYDWEKIADRLRRKPGEWALIFTQDRTSVVVAIRAGSVAPVHPALGFETTTRENRRNQPRTCDLYMRFNPDSVDPLHEALRRKG